MKAVLGLVVACAIGGVLMLSSPAQPTKQNTEREWVAVARVIAQDGSTEEYRVPVHGDEYDCLQSGRDEVEKHQRDDSTTGIVMCFAQGDSLVA